MGISIVDVLAIVKTLVADKDKLNKCREIVSDLKELVNSVKEIVKG